MVAIKDMEMPESCADCERGSICGYGLGYSRAKNCPLVEIVTCKDCKYYRNKENKHSYCTKRLNVDSITDRYREPDYYCADAERKE